MYMFLVHDTAIGWDRIIDGVYSMIHDRTTHPAVLQCTGQAKKGDRTIIRALVLMSLCVETEFVRYLCTLPNVDASAISQFALDILPSLTNDFMDGRVDAEYFVSQATLAYITM